MKPILFIDFDGTLCFDHFWKSLSAKNKKTIHDYLFVKNATFVDNWMRGLHTSEEINKFLAIKLNTPYKELWTIFVNDCNNFQIEKDILVQINSIKSKYFVVLITDNMDSFDRFIVAKLNLKSYFNEIINSYTVKKCKNDNNGQIFRQINNSHHANIGKSILLDDSITSCSIFRNLGGKSYRVTKNRPLNYWLKLL